MECSEVSCFCRRKCLSHLQKALRHDLRTGENEGMVGLGRLELPTSPLSGVRSSHLSYRPVNNLQTLDFVGVCSGVGSPFVWHKPRIRRIIAAQSLRRNQLVLRRRWAYIAVKIAPVDGMLLPWFLWRHHGNSDRRTNWSQEWSHCGDDRYSLLQTCAQKSPRTLSDRIASCQQA